MNKLNEALKQFDITEANLKKLNRLWTIIQKLIPKGTIIKEDLIYEDRCRSFRNILKAIPTIEDYNIKDDLLDLSKILQMRIDAQDSCDETYIVTVEEEIYKQGKSLREYKYQFDRARRSLVRSKSKELISNIDLLIPTFQKMVDRQKEIILKKNKSWISLTNYVAQLDILLGSAGRPPRWNYLQRHLHFSEMGDVRDIVQLDWPEVGSALKSMQYGEEDPIPVNTSDLSDLVKSEPSGEILSKLAWNKLGDEGFERLIYSLISTTTGYENPLWLTHTNAPDRGRDLSVDRIIEDNLAGALRLREIIQCKHWLSKSVGPSDVNNSRAQMELWGPPRVDVLVIATTGRFTTDAIDLIEKSNQGNLALRIEMWADSHLEKLLARRPDIVAEFKLR